ncbi:MAG: carboxypeptidase-like regulatory domain-containing protein [Microscillaceae bacterium]|nr:carboxypeptidase-like regulatory domain-containing protein [Microscillaceae bacterium]
MLLCVPGYGQTTQVNLKGEIRDSIAKPLGFANVIVQRAGNNRVVVFGISNEAGQFDLQFLADTSAYMLIVTILGYGPEKIPLRIDLNQSSQSIEKKLVLKEQSLDLKTVVVEAELPVSQSGDTTRYAVESLTSGSEQNLEAILRKLPGVEVAPNGTVSVNGKQIKSLLIEGEDLFNNQYQLGTKNIPANMIAGVEAIDHYEGDDLMRGVRHSEDMVLNIVLKKKKVNYWLGEAEGGYGPENRRTAKANVFWLNPRHKWYLLGQHNNLGFHPVGLAQAQGKEQIGELMAPEPWLYRLALPTLPINETLLQDKQANLNEAYLGYWGGVDKIGSRFRIQHFTYAYADRFPRTQQLENAYRLGTDSFVLTEDRQQSSLPWQLQGRQKMSLTLNQHTRLDLLTQQEVGSLRHQTHLQTMVSPDLPGFLNENLSENSETQTLFLHQQLCLTQRLDSGWVWKAQLYYTHEERPEHYALSSPRWADFLDSAPNFLNFTKTFSPTARPGGHRLCFWVAYITLPSRLN